MNQSLIDCVLRQGKFEPADRQASPGTGEALPRDRSSPIGGATFGLALEGLLDDRTHTSNAAEYLALTGYAGGDRFVAEPAVVDGDLITASGVAPSG